MNETTMFLAQMIGPVFLAFGVGMFTARNYYLNVYKNIDKETLAMLIASMGMIAAGIAWIVKHPYWTTTPEIIISVLGWITLFKGVMFAIAPRWVENMADAVLESKGVVSGVGFVIVVFGAWLTWFGFGG